MAKNCIITLEPQIVEKAAANATKLGKSLKDVIEDAITTTADIDAENLPWIVEKELENEPWAPSRLTLWNMRRDGRLIAGKHYKKHGRFVYYNKQALKKALVELEEEKARGKVKEPIPETVPVATV